MPQSSTINDQYPTRARNRGLMISGILFLVLLLALGSTVLWSLRQSLQPAHQSTTTHEHPGVQHLVLDADQGTVRVVRAETGTKDLTVTSSLAWNKTKPTESESVSGDTLTVRSRCSQEIHLGFNTCHVSLTVRVPADLPLQLRAGATDTDLEGLSGDVDVQASSGDLRLRDLSGAVRVTAESGDVSAYELRSPQVEARTTSGNIHLEFTAEPSSVTARATSGDISVQVPRQSAGYDVTTAVLSGDANVHVDNVSGSPYHIDLAAESGDLRADYGATPHGQNAPRPTR